MPINRLKKQVDQNPKLKVVYRLWKGTKKPPGDKKGSGRDLKAEYRFEGYDDNTARIFKQAYGKDTVSSLRIYLPFEHPDDVFDPWYAAYDQRLGLMRLCDGDNILRERVIPHDPQAHSYVVECNKPCLRSPDRSYCGDCSHSGKFYFYIREMVESGSGFGCGGMMAISGMNDVESLYSQLFAIYEKYGSLRNAPMPSPATYGMIPYVLSRSKTPFQRKGDEGKGEYTINTHYYAVTIAEDPEFMKDLLLYQRRDEFLAMMSDPKTLALPGIAEKFGISPDQVKQLTSASETVDLSAVIPIRAPEPVPLGEEDYIEAEFDYEETPPAIAPPEKPYDKEAHLREVWKKVSKGNGLSQIGLRTYLQICSVSESSNLTEAQIDAMEILCQDPDNIARLNAKITDMSAALPTPKPQKK
jgi:hypothetical protein